MVLQESGTVLFLRGKGENKMDETLWEKIYGLIETSVPECVEESQRIDRELAKAMQPLTDEAGIEKAELISGAYIDIIAKARCNAYYAGVKHACRAVLGILAENAGIKKAS